METLIILESTSRIAVETKMEIQHMKPLVQGQIKYTYLVNVNYFFFLIKVSVGVQYFHLGL